MTMPDTDNDTDTQADAARKWWDSLRPYETSGGTRHPGDRAALARLRRCTTPMAAVAEPATIDLFGRLGFRNPERNLERVATLAILLANIRESPKGTIARALGPPPGGKPEDAVLKPLRFKRLLGARSPDEILVAFRRAIRMLDRKADVKNLARLILAWDQDGFGDRARVRFAFDYYNTGDFAPDAKPSIEPKKD